MPPTRKTQQVADSSRGTRRERVLNLRVEGNTIREIARVVGVSRETVRRDLAVALDDLHRENLALAERYQTIELRRLDTIERELRRALHAKRLVRSGLAADGEQVYREVDTLDLGVIGRLLEVSDRRRKLLGIDAPQLVEHSGSVDHGLAALDGLTTEQLQQLDAWLDQTTASAVESEGGS